MGNPDQDASVLSLKWIRGVFTCTPRIWMGLLVRNAGGSLNFKGCFLFGFWTGSAPVCMEINSSVNRLLALKSPNLFMDLHLEQVLYRCTRSCSLWACWDSSYSHFWVLIVIQIRDFLDCIFSQDYFCHFSVGSFDSAFFSLTWLLESTPKKSNPTLYTAEVVSPEIIMVQQCRA